MSDEIKNSIIATLAYSDIFDYPLTAAQIWRFLISSKKTSKKSLEKTLALHLRGVSLKKGGLYCFENREEIINKRLRREKESDKKLEFAKKIISKLSIIPTVQLIAVSGALAMRNSDRDDDIDLFVVTKKNSVWISRLLILFILQLLGKRRKRKEKNVKDKICLNFLIDETRLSFPKERQDLYTAHEIVQIAPVLDKNNAYGKFIKANEWVLKFLPNTWERRTVLNYTQNDAEKWFCVVLRIILRFSALEWLAKNIQLWYMRRHRTRETLEDNFLAFHPIDYKTKILFAHKERLKRYGKI